MSGHSKWATTKHRKAAVDKVRGKIFAKLIRQVEVAAREGGSDIESNATLRTMFQKARDASVPLETIERAIKRGTGELEGVRYEPVSYEGYGPAGVAILVECLSDNRNRTGSEIRSIFSRNGGSMAEPGAVSWQFERKGQVVVDGSADEDRLVDIGAEAGADDVTDDGDSHWVVTCPPGDLARVRDAIESGGMAVFSAELVMSPTTTVLVDGESDARKVLRVLELLDDHDDVQNVWSNFDIPDAVLAAVSEE